MVSPSPTSTTSADSSNDGPSSPVAAHLPLIALAFVVLAWGAGPPLTKLVTAEPLVGAMIRFGISFPVLFAIVHFTGREFSTELFRRTLLPGASFGVNLILVFAALQEVTVAVLAVSIAIQPVLLLLIGGPLFGEWPSWK